MPLSILLFLVYLIQLTETVPFDGIIHRSSDGSSYAFLSPPKPGNHASFIEQMTPTGTLAVAWFTGGESQPNCSIALSLLEVGSEQFSPGVVVSERVNYSNQNPVLYWDNGTQILHLYHPTYMHGVPSVLWRLQSKDQGKYIH
jgi:predicted neuraminidase